MSQFRISDVAAILMVLSLIILGVLLMTLPVIGAALLCYAILRSELYCDRLYRLPSLTTMWQMMFIIVMHTAVFGMIWYGILYSDMI